MRVEDVDWEAAKIVVAEEKPEWYEDYDEAEGLFMGWKEVGSNEAVSFSEFRKWWKTKNEA